MSTISAARAAEAALASQIHSTADALSTLGHGALEKALEHLNKEADALRWRIAAVKAAVVEELAGVVAEFEALTTDLAEGMEPVATVMVVTETAVVEVTDPRPIKSPKDDGETVKKDAEAFAVWVEGEYAPGLSAEQSIRNPDPIAEELTTAALSPKEPSPTAPLKPRSRRRK
jgi:hypothetical protein